MGKDILKQIFSFINNYPVEKHFVFIEDYDINVARHLVQGVDVWLNTPVVPMEASGTSGMKAAINGGLNLSILDGWWPEAFNGENGWAISGGSSDNPEISQDAEANHLYELLEGDVTEIFYNRKEADIPLNWVKMMKNSITTVCGRFNMHRTVREYFYKFYQPQMAMSQRISDNGSELLKRINKYKKRIDAIWPQVYVRDYFTSINGNMPISGEKVDVDCYIYLGDADEQLLSVEVFYCFGENAGACMKIPLNYVERYNDKVAKYTGSIGLKGTGLQEISARLVPADPDFRSIYSQYVKWKE
jgi:starch phosphorylase